MNDFVNKIKDKSGTVYDMQDARVPQILAENEGNVLTVEDGALAFKAPSGGGTKLYKHEIKATIIGPSQVVTLTTFISTNNIALDFDNLGDISALNREISLFNNNVVIMYSYGGAGYTFTGIRTIKYSNAETAGEDIALISSQYNTSSYSDFTDTVTEL